MYLTNEQEQCLAAFCRGENMRIYAYAGAGKTSTLRALANARPYERGHYLAFNKSIAQDARSKFAANVECRTLHSMAYRAIINLGYPNEKLTNSLRIAHIDQNINVSNIGARLTRSMLYNGLKRFYQSSDDYVSWWHVPVPPSLKTEPYIKSIRENIALLAQDIWEHQYNLNGEFPLGHDGYLKLWALQRPILNCAYLFVDEAQDLNPVVIGIVENQTHAQIVTVGDSWQQIYEWRGAVDALKKLPGNEYRLSQSFRFGEMIAALADDVLRVGGEVNTLYGNPAIQDDISARTSASCIDCVDTVLCRTNAGVIDCAMSAVKHGSDVYIQGGIAELQTLVEDCHRLMNGKSAQNWELAGFKTWGEVEEYCKDEDAETNIKTFVNLVNRYGIEALKDILLQVKSKQTNRTITISTAHKSKGLEWNSVELHSDFECDNVNEAERRLFYVALTRAKTLLTVDKETVELYT